MGREDLDLLIKKADLYRQKDYISKENYPQNPNKAEIVEAFTNDYGWVTLCSMIQMSNTRDPNNKSHILSFAECKRQHPASSYNDTAEIIKYYDKKINCTNSGAPRFDEKRYNKEDLEFVYKRRKINADKHQARGNLFETIHQTANDIEKSLYPLLEKGFFDLLNLNSGPTKLKSEHYDLLAKKYKAPNPDNNTVIDNSRATIIVPSEYDDASNGADFAMLMPARIKNRDTNEEAIIQLPVCIDVTTSNLNDDEGKLKTITERFKEKHGFTTIKYPSTCTGVALPTINDCLHFTLYLPRNAQTEMFSSNQFNSQPEYSITYQLHNQARIAFDYWARSGEQEKAQLNNIVATQFVPQNRTSYKEVIKYLNALSQL